MRRKQEWAVAPAITLALALGCSKPTVEADNRKAPTVTEAAIVATRPSAEACPPCAAQPNLVFSHVGNYLDASCTQPVAHADVLACAPVSISGDAIVSFAEPTGRHKAGDRGPNKLVRQASPTEVARLFQKHDGRCTPFQALGYKIAPDGCDGKKVCRNANGDLACGTCRLLNDGCPDYVPTRVFAVVAN